MTTKTSSKPRWTAASRDVYKKFPSAIRSDSWPEIVRLANAGKPAAAAAVAKDHEDSSPRAASPGRMASSMRFDACP